jgi:hypothetical protein
MKRLAVLSLGILLVASAAPNALGWGAYHGPRGGAYYRGPMGGAAARGLGGAGYVRGPYGAGAYRGPYGGAGVRGPYGGAAVRGPYGGTPIAPRPAAPITVITMAARQSSPRAIPPPGSRQVFRSERRRVRLHLRPMRRKAPTTTRRRTTLHPSPARGLPHSPTRPRSPRSGKLAAATTWPIVRACRPVAPRR